MIYRESESDPDTMKAAIRQLQDRQEKYEGFLKQLQENGQKAVDSGSHLIAEYEVTNCSTDQGLICKVASLAKEQLEVDTIAVVADKEYDIRKDILNCVYDGTAPVVALKYDKVERSYELPYEEAGIMDQMRRSTKQEDIEKYLKAGVLPSIYEGQGISVDVQTKGCISCFVRDENGNVTCPAGHILRYSRKRGMNTIYYYKEDCKACKNKCIKSERNEVSFGTETYCVPVMVFGIL